MRLPHRHSLTKMEETAVKENKKWTAAILERKFGIRKFEKIPQNRNGEFVAEGLTRALKNMGARTAQ